MAGWQCRFRIVRYADPGRITVKRGVPILCKLRQLPGVEAVGITNMLPAARF
jgi:hypothetical protein